MQFYYGRLEVWLPLDYLQGLQPVPPVAQPAAAVAVAPLALDTTPSSPFSLSLSLEVSSSMSSLSLYLEWDAGVYPPSATTSIYIYVVKLSGRPSLALSGVFREAE